MVISEQIIEQVLQLFEEDIEQILLEKEWIKTHLPEIESFWSTESFDMLTHSEGSYLEFLTAVLTKALKMSNNSPRNFQAERLAKIEEGNWKILAESKKTGFRSRIDPFFEQYTEEDALAFIEDSLTIDEEAEEVMSTAAQEFMFVVMKSILDVLTKDLELHQ